VAGEDRQRPPYANFESAEDGKGRLCGTTVFCWWLAHALTRKIKIGFAGSLAGLEDFEGTAPFGVAGELQKRQVEKIGRG
jgi:hypothetical protein